MQKLPLPLKSWAFLVLGAVVGGCAHGGGATGGPVAASGGAVATVERTALPASCQGVASSLENGFFSGSRRALRVEPVMGERRIGARTAVPRVSGARVYVTADLGVTEPYLERVARCYVDSYQAGLRQDGRDPVAVPGAQVRVVAVNAGYALDITAESQASSGAIYERALGIASPGAEAQAPL